MLVLFAVLVSIFIHLAIPTELIQISANIAVGCMLVFPPMLVYLNRRLPRPARLGVVGFLALAANTVFFGLFFVNFVVQRFTGGPLFTL